MTDAYIEGFCKTAEEHGVDPVALLKEAGVRGNVVLKALNGLIRKTPHIIDDNYVSLLRHTSPEALRLIGTPLTSSGAKAAFKGFKAQELRKAISRRIDDVYKGPEGDWETQSAATRKLVSSLLKRDRRLANAEQRAFSHPELNTVSWSGRAYPDKKRLDWLKGLLDKHVNS